MPYDLTQLLVIGISSRSLFNLEEEALMEPGTAFSLVKGFLDLNKRQDKRLVEVIIMSKNSPDTGLRIFNSIEHHGLDISRAALTGGEPLSPYLEAFNIDLFLSKSESDVQTAIDAGVAAALLYDPPYESPIEAEKLRIAFDADAVLFSEESEAIYRSEGLEAFFENERSNADKPLQEGPFAKDGGVPPGYTARCLDISRGRLRRQRHGLGPGYRYGYNYQTRLGRPDPG